MAEREHVTSELAQKYNQPKGVEQFGIEPIPPHLKTVKWYDLFFIVVNFIINPAQILIAGLAVASGLSFWAAVTAITLGVLVVYIPYLIMATVGVDYGLPGLVSTRMVFGIRGAKWTASLVRVIGSIFFFALQTIAGAVAITAVLNTWLGVEVSLVIVSLVFAVLQVAVALFGYNFLKNLSRIAFPFKIVILTFLFFVIATHEAPGFSPAEVFSYGGEVGWQWSVFVVWFSAMLATWINLTTDAADFCRYSSTRVDMWIGTLAAAFVGVVLTSMFGAYGAAATGGEVNNAFEVVTNVTTNGLILSLLLIVVVLDNWTINVLNLYTGGLAISNAFSRIGRFWATLMVSVGGVGLSLFPEGIINQFGQLANTVGILFVPISGVLIVDYLLVKRMHIDVLALFDRNGPYWYTWGFNFVAIAWLLIGAAIYYFLPQQFIPPLITFIVTGVGYYVTVRIVAPRYEPLAAGAKPGKQYEEISEEQIASIT